MTDTNQASLFELCKKVYELTGWEAPETYKAEDGNPENDWQAYDTDYLLEKLPATLNDDEGDLYRLTVRQVGDDWLANYVYDNVGMWHRFADTPLKALLELTIALSEAGELK